MIRFDRVPGTTTHLRIWLDNPSNKLKFMGIKKSKKNDFYTVGNNLVNLVVLDLLGTIKINMPEEVDYCLPDGLFHYQVPDVLKMLSTKKALNANRMGYGKTVEAIAALRAANVKNAVIIAPKPVLAQWQSQFDKWWKDHPEIAINPKTLIDGINLLNYEQTIQDARQVQLKSRRWGAVVVDESHRIKTPGTKRTEAATSIPAELRYALTGTPILIHPEDLYAQLRFLDPFYCGASFYDFRNYFCKVRMGIFGEEILGLTHDDFHVKVLHRLLEYVAVRNPEMELAKGKRVITQKVSMSAKQRKLYTDIVNLMLDELPENVTITNGAVRTLRAQQATTCPSHFIESLWGEKFEWVKMILQDNADLKLVVFSKFSTAIKELQKFLKKNKIQCTLYHGTQSNLEKEESKRAFIGNPEVRVLAGTIGCMGEGVDGLQNAAHVAIFLDRPYSPEIAKQCEDRLHRPGQHNEVLCYYLECVGTFDRYYGRKLDQRDIDIRKALQYDSSDT